MNTSLILLAIGLLCLGGCVPKSENEMHHGTGTHVYYTCSMDPQVVTKKPGRCPICHMELTPMAFDPMQQHGITLSQTQERLANIQVRTVRYGRLEDVVVANGLVQENPGEQTLVSARLEGRVERLYVKSAGSEVRKGQVLYTLSSEMLAATQNELIQTSRALEKQPQDPTLAAIQLAAIQRLRSWNLTEEQIQTIQKSAVPRLPFPILSPVQGIVSYVLVSEGAEIMEGQPLFEFASYATFWVEAELYGSESDQLNKSQRVDIVLPGLTEPLAGRVLQDLPQVAPSSTIHLVRIGIQPPSRADVRPGMQAGVYLRPTGNKSLIVPTAAILREETNAQVWVKGDSGRYEPRSVRLGKESETEAEVLQGLMAGEEVVVSGAYLLQSEHTFRKAALPRDDHTM